MPQAQIGMQEVGMHSPRGSPPDVRCWLLENSGPDPGPDVLARNLRGFYRGGDWGPKAQVLDGRIWLECSGFSLCGTPMRYPELIPLAAGGQPVPNCTVPLASGLNLGPGVSWSRKLTQRAERGSTSCRPECYKTPTPFQEWPPNQKPRRELKPVKM